MEPIVYAMFVTLIVLAVIFTIDYIQSKGQVMVELTKRQEEQIATAVMSGGHSLIAGMDDSMLNGSMSLQRMSERQ